MAGPPQAVGAPDELGEIRLLANQFTRIGGLVSLDGQGPFTFVIDTGAGVTAISDTIAARLALPDRGPLLVHGATAASVTPSVGVRRLTLAGLDFANLRCPILPGSQMGADGLLGLDVLGRFKLHFDTVRKTARLTDAEGLRVVHGATRETGTRISRGGSRTRMGAGGQMVLTQVEVEGQPVAAFIDSGAQYSIGNLELWRAIAARRTGYARLPRPVAVYGVAGESLRADLARVETLRLDKAHLGPTPLLFADLHCFETLGLGDRPALLIAADLLGRFREVNLDFPRRRVSFVGLRPAFPRPPAGA